MLKRLGWLVLFLGWPALVWAHFLITVPSRGGGYGVRGQETSFWLLFGHPFEGILYDLKVPRAYMINPSGQKESLSLVRIEVKDYASGKKRFGYRASYLPTRRGDYLLCVVSQPYLNEEEGVVWQDHIKVPFHVQVEKGWENRCGFTLEMVPLTRPYGLRVGQVLRGRVLLQGKPAAGVTIEVEKFNGFYIPDEKLPVDAYGRINDPLITQTLVTDEEGYFVVGFPEAGWWVVNASVSAGKTHYANRTFPLVIRSGMWIYVFPSPHLPSTGLELLKGLH